MMQRKEEVKRKEVPVKKKWWREEWVCSSSLLAPGSLLFLGKKKQHQRKVHRTWMSNWFWVLPFVAHFRVWKRETETNRLKQGVYSLWWKVCESYREEECIAMICVNTLLTKHLHRQLWLHQHLVFNISVPSRGEGSRAREWKKAINTLCCLTSTFTSGCQEEYYSVIILPVIDSIMGGK